MEKVMNKRIHAVIIPYPLQGHVTPTVHLATILASKGVTITFVNTEVIHRQMSRAQSDSVQNIFSESRKQGHDIRYMTISDGLPVEFDRSLNHDQFMFSLLHVMSAHVEQLLLEISQDDPPVSCMVADTFFVWPAPLAKKFKLLYISFWTEPALVFTIYHHMGLLREHGHFASVDNRDDTINYIPGVPTIEPTDLPSYLQETDISTVCHQINDGAFRGVKHADWILCNTVQELEPSIIGALNQDMSFYAIGPIFPSCFKKSSTSTSLWCESDCTEWLDSKPPGSVLYVSFGSYAHVEMEELLEIAWGLLLSKCDFVWVLRPDIVASGKELPLPEGFLEKIKGRGLIVPWSCQIAVLSHSSIGGFLTHCGWNSVLESIWCGVPMLGFPLLTDQFTNRKLVVDEWKIGNYIGKKKAVSRDEVSCKIKELMTGKSGEEFRQEILKVKRALQNAVMPGGSSAKNLERFIEDLTSRVNGKV